MFRSFICRIDQRREMHQGRESVSIIQLVSLTILIPDRSESWDPSQHLHERAILGRIIPQWAAKLE